MRITIKLDDDTMELLMKAAEIERRPLAWQAEVIIRRALGLPFPYPDKEKEETPNDG